MRIKKIVNKYKTELIVLSVFLILLAVTFVPQVLSGLAFSYGYDMRQQYFAFFEEFRKQWTGWISLSSIPNLLSGELPFYSWNMFLGSNFIASKAYYTVGDLYNYLFLPFQNMHYFDIRFLQTLLKFSMAALSMYFYLRMFYKKTMTLTIGVISYAFSFWIIYFIGQPMFISFYSLVPLYFLGMESYLQNKKKILFIFMTMILLCINYYLFYTLSFFSVIYYLYRYFCLNKEWKNFIKETSILIGYYLIGVLMSMILIYPAALYMLENNRIGGMETNLLYPDIRIYFHMIQSFFSPNYMMDKSELINAFTITNYRYDEIPLWSGILTTLLLPQVLSDKEVRFKKATLIMYAFFILMFLFPIGGSILHGFSETSFRWLFFVIFMNIFLSCRYLESIDTLDLKNLKLSAGVAVAVNCLTIPILLVVTGRIDTLVNFLGQYSYALFFAVLIALSTWLIIKNPVWKNKGLILLSCIGILSISNHYQKAPAPLETNSWEYIQRRTAGLQSENQELLQFLRENGEPIDEMYYRFLLDYDGLYGSYSFNSSIFYGLNDLMTYDSTVSPSIYDLMQFSDADFYDQKWVINFQNAGLVNFLSTEYAVVLSEDLLPHDNFELIGDYFGIPVYKNLSVVHFGTTYSSVVTYQELIDKNINTTSQLAKHIIVDTEEEKNEIQSYLASDKEASMTQIDYRGNHLSGMIEVDDSTFMVVQLPFDSGWSILVNGVSSEIYRVNGGMMGVVLPKGVSEIQMYFVPQGLKEGLVLSFVGGSMFLILIIQEIYKKRKTKKIDS